jgi:2-octaprenylphenol hydroxylase
MSATRAASEFDLAVVGAGLVGAAFAAAAARAGFRVALLEAQAPRAPDPTADLDLRVSALSRASERLLRGLGAWDSVGPARCSSYQRMVVWDAVDEGATSEVAFDAADLGEPDLGHIVENRALQHALWQAAAAAGVALRAPAVVTGLQVADRHATLTLADGNRVSASLVVAADGAGSPLRTLAGLGVDTQDYDQHAVVAHLRSVVPHQRTAWQRFQPGGPLALLPLADGRVSIVWSTTPEHAAELLSLDDAAFGAAVTDGSGARLGALSAASPRARFPLRRQHAAHYAGDRVVLIGDAAHVVHPLAGQGVNLGFQDAVALLATLEHARESDDDPGETATLRRYERERRGANAAMIELMDGFKRLFGDQRGAVASLRDAGMRAFDRSGPLKRAVMRGALGLDRRRPTP